MLNRSNVDRFAVTVVLALLANAASNVQVFA
jgi:hypothetical protein